MTPIQLVIPIEPGLARINGRYEIRWSPKRPTMRPRLVLGKRYASAKQAIVEHVRRFVFEHRFVFETIRSGEVAVAIVTYWPRVDAQLSGLGRPVPIGDVDAVAKCVLDGLAEGGLFDTDARVTELHLRKAYDHGRPRIAVSVWSVDESTGPVKK